jgi:hypothetical protein
VFIFVASDVAAFTTIFPAADMVLLPSIPNAIDESVVQEKNRIRRRTQVAHVPANEAMQSAMQIF